ncbi:hypothetical protein FACS1894166_07600 [Bacilli bacterium]|nr:hypothetical protein FACS1894166_07600 [Bacilli bacterium]
MDDPLKKLAPHSDSPSAANASAFSGKSAKPNDDTTTGFTQIYSAAISGSADHIGAKSLILPGFLHETPLETFRKQSKSVFESAGYILIDQNFAVKDNHVASVMFRSDQSAFLTGLATAQYLNENFAEYYKPNKPLAVGTYGGMAIPTVTIFMGGLE